MDTNRDDLDILEARARRGDAAALARLRQQLEPQVARVVRRAMRSNNPTAPLTARLLAEVKRVERETPPPRQAPSEQVIGQVARRLCSSVFGLWHKGARGGHALRETVVN